MKLLVQGVFNMKLQTYLKKHNKRTADMARDFCLKHCIVRRWVKGLCVPTVENMQKIFAYTNGEVTPNDFYDINEKEEN